ncbi:MAG: DUF488 domain-containing protein [Syntrophales bacterium]|nr:DUF488 domain-containing protein [Syntrophales bacterium]
MTRHHNSTVIFTIGHSNHPIDWFITLLKIHGIKALADVRSSPYSRFNPQFNMKALDETLKKENIDYIFMGNELGGKPKKQASSDAIQLDFKSLVSRKEFQSGIERVLNIAEMQRLVLMCAEKEPLDCHRTIVICRYLRTCGINILHILADGSTEDHRQTELRLLKITHPLPNFFSPDDELEIIEQAYDRRWAEMIRKSSK